MRLPSCLAIAVVIQSAGYVLAQTGPAPGSAPAPAAASNTIAGFWSAVLEKYCSKRKTCTPSNDPGADVSTLLTFLDDALIGSVWATQQKTKLLQLKQQSLDSLISLIAPANDASAGPQGSPVQTEAVPSSIPVAQSGVNAGVAGTPTGMRLVTSVALNPAGLVTTSASTTDPGAQKAGTLAARIADLSVVLPIDTTGNRKPTSGALGSFDFVGVRLRLNALPFFQDDLYGQARKISEMSFAKALAAEGSASDSIASLLSSFDPSGCAQAIAMGAPTPRQCSSPQPADFARQIAAAARCADAIESAVQDQIVAQCGKPIPQLDAERTTELALYNALQFRRDQHDADYVGLDIRYDYGDPTFSNDPAARGNYLLAGAAAGHRFLGGGATDSARRFFGVRARLGWSYASLTQSGSTNNSVDYAGGLEIGTITDFKVLKLSAGVEGRQTSGTPAATVDTNFIDTKIGVEIPLANGAKLGAVLSIPVNGNHVTTLGVSANWNALLGALQPPARPAGL